MSDLETVTQERDALIVQADGLLDDPLRARAELAARPSRADVLREAWTSEVENLQRQQRQQRQHAAERGEAGGAS